MTREQEYRQLANSAFKHAAEEESAQLMAQWKILGAKYLELADQSEKIGANQMRPFADYNDCVLARNYFRSPHRPQRVVQYDRLQAGLDGQLNRLDDHK